MTPKHAIVHFHTRLHNYERNFGFYKDVLQKRLQFDNLLNIQILTRRCFAFRCKVLVFFHNSFSRKKREHSCLHRSFLNSMTSKRSSNTALFKNTRFFKKRFFLKKEKSYDEKKKLLKLKNHSRTFFLGSYLKTF